MVCRRVDHIDRVTGKVDECRLAAQCVWRMALKAHLWSMALKAHLWRMALKAHLWRDLGRIRPFHASKCPPNQA